MNSHPVDVAARPRVPVQTLTHSHRAVGDAAADVLVAGMAAPREDQEPVLRPFDWRAGLKHGPRSSA